MMKLRAASERGTLDKGWLQSHHTFSFETYYDPDFLGFHSLGVLNENRLQPGKGWGMQSHRDVEMATYVLEGVLEYADGQGLSTVIRPGEIQMVSAGSGVNQRVNNLSHQVPVHFLQMWFIPRQYGLTPSCKQKIFTSASKWGQWCLLLSSNGREGSLRVQQDADVYSTLLDENDELTFEALIGRNYWLHVVSGKFLVQETPLHTGDGAAVIDEELITVKALEAGELLLFDLAS